MLLNTLSASAGLSPIICQPQDGFSLGGDFGGFGSQGAAYSSQLPRFEGLSTSPTQGTSYGAGATFGTRLDCLNPSSLLMSWQLSRLSRPSWNSSIPHRSTMCRTIYDDRVCSIKTTQKMSSCLVLWNEASFWPS